MTTLVERLAVYLVADPEQTRRDLVTDVKAALAGGVTAVQLRAKSLTDREIVELAARIGDLCREHRALFLVNDRCDIALAAGAHGVHLGVDDLPVEYARKILGNDAVIGYSPDTDEAAATAWQVGASYLGVGPVFATSSKSDAGVAIGLDGLKRRVAIARVPVIGIGGIDSANASQVIDSGAVGVAVIGAVLRANDPGAAARGLAAAVTLARGVRP